MTSCTEYDLISKRHKKSFCVISSKKQDSMPNEKKKFDPEFSFWVYFYTC